MAVALLPRPATAATAKPATSLTLAEAVAIAFERSPRLRSASARVAEAEGRLLGARTYPFNPEIEVEGAARIRPGDDVGDMAIGVDQEIEIAGQRGRRVATLSAELEAARSGELRRKRLLAAEVHLAFLAALEAKDLLEVAQAERGLAGELLDLTRRRLEAGAGTQLDVNVAAADLGRAEQTAGHAEGRYAITRAALAEALGMDPAALPVPMGKLDEPMSPPLPLGVLVESARAHRADLEELRATSRAARARIDLARAEAWPNLRVGVFAGREDGTDTLVGLRLAIPLPIFQRNQGGIAEARAGARRAVAERETADLGVVREVVTAYEQYRSAAKVLESLRTRVLGTVEENLDLLRRAFEAGETDWVTVLVMRRALFDARRALVTTSAEVRRARTTIDIAAGRMPLPAGRSTESER